MNFNGLSHWTRPLVKLVPGNTDEPNGIPMQDDVFTDDQRTVLLSWPAITPFQGKLYLEPSLITSEGQKQTLITWLAAFESKKRRTEEGLV